MPNLLYWTLMDSDKAWHFRCLEFWGMRTGWGTWAKFWQSGAEWYDATQFGRELPTKNANIEEHLNGYRKFLKGGGLSFFRKILRSQLHLGPRAVREWSHKMENGWDEPFKVMVMAMAPALHRVRFIDDGYGFDQYPSGPLPCLSLAIKHTARWQNAIWPPGFKSLREIYVGSTTDRTSSNFATRSSSCLRPSAVAALFLLPNLKVLHLTCDPHGDDHPNEDFSFTAKSSSIEELAFFRGENELGSLRKLIEIPRRLRKFVTDHRHSELLLKRLGEHHAQSLETLMARIHMDQLEDRQLLLSFTNLKVLERMESFAIPDTTQHDELVYTSLQQLFPPSLTSLTLGYPFGSLDLETTMEVREASIMHCIADLAADVHFTGLKTICLRYMMQDDEIPLARTVKNVHHEQIRQMEARGIDLHLHNHAGQVRGIFEEFKEHPLTWEDKLETDN